MLLIATPTLAHVHLFKHAVGHALEHAELVNQKGVVILQLRKLAPQPTQRLHFADFHFLYSKSPAVLVHEEVPASDSAPISSKILSLRVGLVLSSSPLKEE